MLPRFVNNGFKPYVEQLYQAAPVFQTRFFFIKVLLVLPTLLWQILRDTFIEVILVFLFFLIVNKMSQGRDMVVSFFEPEGLYGIARVGFTTLTIIIYSVCMWLVPVFLFEYRDKLKSKNPAGTSGVSLFDTHLFFAHRILALLPFWIFCYAIHHTLFMNIVIFMGIIAELIALHYIYNHVSLRGKIRIIHWIVTILILIAGAIVWIYYQHQYLLVKHFYTVFVFLISFAMYMSFHACDKKLLAAKMTKPVGKFTGWHYKTSHIIYIAMAAFQIITMILCIWVFNLKSVVPESLLLFIFSFYVFFIDLIHYVAKLSNRWRFWINSLGFIFFVLIGLRLFMSFNHDRINYKDTKEKYIASDLKAMEDYFEVWKK
jgi:hypothetical protein